MIGTEKAAHYFYDLEFLEVAIKQGTAYYQEVYDFYEEQFGQPTDTEQSECKVDVFRWKVEHRAETEKEE